ncbi:hypothetical protein E4U46_008157 [Claviceps purpurea]|nr:hypothetical protein E4U46_008157 [Claviceps purpurea]
MELFHVNFKPAAERLDEKAASDEAHGPYGRRRLELGGLLGGCLGAARTVDAALRVTVAPAKIANWTTHATEPSGRCHREQDFAGTASDMSASCEVSRCRSRSVVSVPDVECGLGVTAFLHFCILGYIVCSNVVRGAYRVDAVPDAANHDILTVAYIVECRSHVLSSHHSTLTTAPGLMASGFLLFRVPSLSAVP